MRLTLDESEPGVTVVKLTHTDIPEEDRLVLVDVIRKIVTFWSYLTSCYKFSLVERL